MDITSIHKQLIDDFNLQTLPGDEREEMLIEIAKTIQKQFLFDLYDILGAKQFEALQTSAQMGEEFYGTTLKHLVPSYEEVFLNAKQKVVKAFHR